MTVELIAITRYLHGSVQDLLEHAGRVCYRSEGSNPDFLKARIREGHESLIEHASATFEITCSRACSHQLVRHRIASYSQESQRYVAMEDVVFITPSAVAVNDEAFRVYARSVSAATRAYSALRDLGIRKEDARYLLPNATMTRIVVTMNFRSWRHFIQERTNKAAQWEIREIALEIQRILRIEAPAVFCDLEAE